MQLLVYISLCALLEDAAFGAAFGLHKFPYVLQIVAELRSFGLHKSYGFCAVCSQWRRLGLHNPVFSRQFALLTILLVYITWCSSTGRAGSFFVRNIEAEMRQAFLAQDMGIVMRQAFSCGI